MFRLFNEAESLILPGCYVGHKTLTRELNTKPSIYPELTAEMYPSVRTTHTNTALFCCYGDGSRHCARESVSESMLRVLITSQTRLPDAPQTHPVSKDVYNSRVHDHDCQHNVWIISSSLLSKSPTNNKNGLFA